MRKLCRIFLVIFVPFLVYLHRTATIIDLSDTHDERVSTVQRKSPLTRRNQKLVILPGPHKTGTTTVQAALFQWMQQTTFPTNDAKAHSEDRQFRNSSSLFKDWAYPVPTRQDFEAINSSYSKLVGGKGFSPMVTRLFANPSATVSAEDVIQSSPLLRLYRQKIQQAWKAGYNVVIASEHLDRLVTPTSAAKPSTITISPNQLWERFLRLLPSTDNVIIGIQHRTPRIDHLISLWHHVGKQDESLLDYITKPIKPGLASTAYSLDALGLANFFVQRGYVVRILDTGAPLPSILETRSLPVAVACHLLQISTDLHTCAEAFDDSSILGKDKRDAHLNQRSDPGERQVDSHTLQAIDRLLLDHDCQFHYDFVVRQKIQWSGDKTFAPDSFATSFVNCSELPETAGTKRSGFGNTKKPFSETVRAIVFLVCQKYPSAKHCRR